MSGVFNSEAIDYIKKPTQEFVSESWRLVKRCTKPDRAGALLQHACKSTCDAHLCAEKSQTASDGACCAHEPSSTVP